MKKIALVLTVIFTILFVIFAVSGGVPPREEMFPVAVFLFLLSLPGILLSLVTLIPPIRKRAQNNLAVRVVTLLVVMILPSIVLFAAFQRIMVEGHYIFASIPSMDPEEIYDYTEVEIKEFEAKYAEKLVEKHEAVVYETWIRVMVPSLLRRPCYTNEKIVCELVDQFPENRELMSRNYLQGSAFPLALSLPGGVLAWYFTRRKAPQVEV
ncbi:hypothetical protein ACFLXQ_00785 [Chloroflexota bacterium]